MLSIRHLTVATFAVLPLVANAEETISYSRDVRPILASRCFKCHGPDPDTREADLRLDQPSTAYEDRGGYAAVVKGKPEESELVLRITSDDPSDRMPPGEPLEAEQIETLRRWIASGGQYETHWAFVPPERPELPQVQSRDWCRTPIDRFILKRLEAASLSPTAEADRATLIRRLYLDLCGVTPPSDEVDKFVADDDPQAYRKRVDQLLASPQYAERFARPWLDLARYSDTNGYEKDRPRSIWPYRDWVIDAISADLPYDQFSIEQLAGDMLPNATLPQQIATGFHRNTMLNEEGGIDPLEYRYYALVDRVATTGTVWMGLTTGCAQCHTHKYDPITHTEYFALMALLNQADEPDVVVETELQRAERLEITKQIETAERELAAQVLPSLEALKIKKYAENSVEAKFSEWLDEQIEASRSWQAIAPSSLQTTMPRLTLLPDRSILASGDVTKRDVYQLEFELDQSHVGATAIRLEVLPHDSLPAGGPGMAFYEGRRGDFFLSELRTTLNDQPLDLANASHSFGNISVGSGSADAANVLDGEGSTGWSTSGQEGNANQWVAEFATPIEQPGTLRIEMLFERHFAAALGRFRIALSDGPKPLQASKLPSELYDWQATDRSDLTDEDYDRLRRHFVSTAIEFERQRQPIEELRKRLSETVRTLGMSERQPEHRRTTHRHHRGEYLQPKETVEPGVPEIFETEEQAQPQNRLEFARWLVSEDNPLVARVAVNRAWRAFFGRGIVDTAGDFGTQSQSPTHPELLDYLAVDFRAGGWSLKRLHRQIVLSATYRQQILDPPAEDPQNQLFGVFPHRRLEAETLRDAMLSAAGLLTHRVGGESVYPPQPDSVMQMAYGSPKWDAASGGDRYRRSLYTFSKRTAPFAAYTTFDAPTGELCTPRRQTSTTPLQALTLLNDPMYLEIAEGLAERAVRIAGSQASPETIATEMFRLLLAREPSDEEITALVTFHSQQHQHPDAWMLVARALMNTDEAISIP